MDEQPHIVTGNTVSEQPSSTAAPIKNKTSLKKKLDTIFTIFFSVCIFLAVFAGIYYLGTGKSLVPQIPKAAQPTSVVPVKKESEVTQKTKIAKSLTVPALYSGLQWKKEDKSAKDDSLKEITGFNTDDENNVVKIPLAQGILYTAAQTESTNNEVYNYYDKQLQKLGWVAEGNTTNINMAFRSFTLEPIIADSACGGTNGYLGYKGDMVRVITISYNANPCSPASSQSNETKSPPLDYSIFISDPIPLNYFADYLSKHANK